MPTSGSVLEQISLAFRDVRKTPLNAYPVPLMADGAQQRALTAAFPPPPPFWKHFTPANLQKLEEIKQEAREGQDPKGKKKWTPAELRALKVPPELRFLIPPEVPSNGHYSVFGELQSVGDIILTSVA